MHTFSYHHEFAFAADTVTARLLDQDVLHCFVARQHPEGAAEIHADRESLRAICGWNVALPMGLGLATVTFELDLRANRLKADIRAVQGAAAAIEGSLHVFDGDTGGVVEVEGQFSVQGAPIPFAEHLLGGVPKDLLNELSSCIVDAEST